MVDPNEIALTELKDFLRKHAPATRVVNPNPQTPGLYWIDYPNNETYYAAAAAFGEITKGCSGPFGGWLGYLTWSAHNHTATAFQRKNCRHCQRSFADHVNGQCLFGSTTFAI